jgi:hypothetical protein
MGYLDRRRSLKMRRRKGQAKKKARLKRQREVKKVASPAPKKAAARKSKAPAAG